MEKGKSFNPLEVASLPLPQKPRLAPWVNLIDLGDHRLQFRAADFCFTLSHKLFLEAFLTVKPLLDGSQSLKQIESAGGKAIQPTTIRFLLQMLHANGLLQEANHVSDFPLTAEEIKKYQSQIDYWSHFFPDGNHALALFNKAKIGLVGSGRLKSVICQSLQSIGINKIENLDVPVEKINSENLSAHFNSIDYLIACQISPNPYFFELINGFCLETRTRWMQVAIEGTKGILGPTFIPYQTACYKCYEQRIASNVGDLESHNAYQNKLYDLKKVPNEGYCPPLESNLSSQSALELARILSAFAPPQTIGRFYEISGSSMSLNVHPVLRVPRCPACRPQPPAKENWGTLTS